MNIRTFVRIGKIKSFNRETGKGKVTIRKIDYPFCFTCFFSGGYNRFPINGEIVEIGFDHENKDIVSVRAKKL